MFAFTVVKNKGLNLKEVWNSIHIAVRQMTPSDIIFNFIKLFTICWLVVCCIEHRIYVCIIPLSIFTAHTTLNYFDRSSYQNIGLYEVVVKIIKLKSIYCLHVLCRFAENEFPFSGNEAGRPSPTYCHPDTQDRREWLPMPWWFQRGKKLVLFT